ncbi:LacI family DNA-binding transcriptional regulator [Rhizocola hellebori]|uniref:LacI family DNA-binding transcriptional regulator n=1 Tax=Rhizocola hellebori TaxID=1392758 RepID=UPI001EF2CFC2|nr:LacI family DNA-binding transcriptional regulator [Rhizocola hellebori]
MTQQDIARMTGVSQATVSIVLNGRSEGEVRIAPETRDRVLRAIAETGYVADPVARRLAAGHNRIIGVFTYESVFPTSNSDFYHPFLVGIEQRAESLGSDLLLLTSAPVVDGRRRIFHEGNRLRLADGCVLLGRSLDREELARLLADGLHFVSIGRRDDAGGPVPYVGADYAAAVSALVHRAVRLGHTNLAYLGHGGPAESWADRMRGFTDTVSSLGVQGIHLPPATPAPAAVGGVGGGVAEVWERVRAAGVTAVFAEDHADGVALYQHAKQLGVPLSIATLGEPMRPGNESNVEFSGFRIPRQRMGAEAMDVLTALIEGNPTQTQRLLECELVVGETLVERK